MISDAPLVSVIIIFLNAERFIIEAVESIFAQSYQAWELLLVDDGSTDGSSAIAQQYAEQRPQQVRYLTHKDKDNRGMSAARNLGIEHARGAYLAFLDADDVWLPQKLEQQVPLLETHPQAAMVYAPVQWWFDWTGKPEDQGRDSIDRMAIEADTLVAPPALVLELLRRETSTIAGGLVRRDVAEQIGGFEERFGGMYEDQAFFAKVGLRWPIYVASKSWYKWRKHADSCCAQTVAAGAYNKTRRAFLLWLRECLMKQGIADQALQRALRQAERYVETPALQRFKERVHPATRAVKQLGKAVAREILPIATQQRLRHWLSGNGGSPPVGAVELGSLRRLTPISRHWGFERGQPVDRYYIENFLAARAVDIQGRVLEIASNDYTLKFGGARVTKSDVLHAVPGNSQATIVADLQHAEQIPSELFDCIICTQTLLVIYDVRAALRTLYRILKPGGVLLVTVPGCAHQIAREDMERWGDYWRFTSLAVRRLFEECFQPAQIEIETFGNVLTAISFLHGLAAAELQPEELDYRDPNYEVTIAVRAVKAALQTAESVA